MNENIILKIEKFFFLGGVGNLENMIRAAGAPNMEILVPFAGKLLGLALQAIKPAKEVAGFLAGKIGTWGGHGFYPR
jgi:hypothetical protein